MLGQNLDGDGDALSAPARTYQVRTYGCQMNVHDSERLAGLLDAAGYRRAPEGADADVVVFNTCAVRENADNKLYGNLSHLAPRKQADPTCRSPSVVVWPRRTGTPCSRGRRGSTWCSAPTTSARCRPCWSGPGITVRRRWRSPRRCGSSLGAARSARIRLRRMGFGFGGV